MVLVNNYYNLLKKYSKSEIFHLEDGSEYIIDNVLYIQYKKKAKNCYFQIVTPYFKIINELTSYANGMNRYDLRRIKLTIVIMK